MSVSISSTSETSFPPGSFANAMLEPPSGHKTKRMLQSVVSLIVHTSVLVALVVVPLLITNSLSLQHLNDALVLAPSVPAPPPPRVMAVRADAVEPKFKLVAAKLSAPTVVPKSVAMSAPDVGAMPAIESASGVFGGTGGILGGTGLAAPPPPPAAASAPKKPLLISGNMKQPVLVYAPELLYPPLAKVAHVAGTVVILAVIDEHGNVVQARAVSGPPLLVPAALRSVSQRRYQPTILDGEPTSVQLNVIVDFHFAS